MILKFTDIEPPMWKCVSWPVNYDLGNSRQLLNEDAALAEKHRKVYSSVHI